VENNWELIVHKIARKKIEKIPQKERLRIDKSFSLLLIDPKKCDFKPLEGRPEWSLRIGRWRILINIDITNRTFIVTDFGPRGDVYKK
jgi:mRNA interferase RelE/StbE